MVYVSSYVEIHIYNFHTKGHTILYKILHCKRTLIRQHLFLANLCYTNNLLTFLSWKRHLLLKFINKAFIELTLTSNINYYWNLGAPLIFCLIIHLITGILLAMHYCLKIIHSFDSITHIERNIYSGDMLRNILANRASIFFLCVYLHIRRNI